jgi:hypothetical protein
LFSQSKAATVANVTVPEKTEETRIDIFSDGIRKRTHTNCSRDVVATSKSKNRYTESDMQSHQLLTEGANAIHHSRPETLGGIIDDDARRNRNGPENTPLRIPNRRAFSNAIPRDSFRAAVLLESVWDALY